MVILFALFPRVLSQTKQCMIFFFDSSTLKHFSFFSFFSNSTRVELSGTKNKTEITAIDSARELKKKYHKFLNSHSVAAK